MQNLSVTWTDPASLARPTAMSGSSSNEVPPGQMSNLQGVSNTPWSRLSRSPMTAGAARDVTPAERQFRTAIGLRWAFHLRSQAMSPVADVVVDCLIRCMDTETMPLPAVLRLWDNAFGDLRPRDRAGAATLAAAGAVRQMLGQGPDHVRVADEITQGIWIKAGVMAGALWPKQFEGRVVPSNDTLALANQAIIEILCCQNAGDLMQCAVGFKGFACDLRMPREDGRPRSTDTLAFSLGLDAAARFVRAGDNDAYYSLLGRQLTAVGACDRAFLQIAASRSQ